MNEKHPEQLKPPMERMGEVEGTERPKDKAELGFRLMEKLYRLGRSIFGKGLLLFFTVAGLKLGLDYCKTSSTAKEAWLEFSKKHPQITRIYYEDLNRVPESKRNEILEKRKTIYELRVNDAIAMYQEKYGNRIPPNVLEAVRSFNPVIIDQELYKMGLGSLVKTNKPLPALQFEDPDKILKSFFAPSGDLVGEFVSRFDEDFISPTNSKEDIIYLDPSEHHPSDELEQILVHEYLHSIQFRKEGDSEKPLLKPLERKDNRYLFYLFIDERECTEGITDLLRLELNSRLGKKSLGMSYPGETFAIYEIMHSLGEEKFWRLFSEGDLEGIITEFDKIYGDGMASTLLNSYSGGAALCTPSWVSSIEAIETFDNLREKGLLADNHFQDFTRKYGLYFPSASEKFIQHSDGSTIAFMNIINKKHIQISIKGRSGKIHLITDGELNKDEFSINEIPELKQLWKSYLFCVTPDARRLAKTNLKEALRKYAEKIYQRE